MKIPFSLLPQNLLRRLSKKILGLENIAKPFFPFLELNLKQAKVDMDAREYLAMCLTATMFFFSFIFAMALIITYFAAVENFIIVSLVISLALAFFVFIQQTIYPKLVASRHIRDIERNLLPALRTLTIHVNSGIPLFDTMVAIARGNFGEVSNEFRTIIKKINSGVPAVEALEESAATNPSNYYRRALWQVANGMKAGSDVSDVLQETINNLSTEQIIQIEHYGSQLNPLAMFYMIIAVIIPALSMTLLIILSSFLSLEAVLVKTAFYGLFVLVLFFQIMFLGMIKTRRPNLI